MTVVSIFVQNAHRCRFGDGLVGAKALTGNVVVALAVVVCCSSDWLSMWLQLWLWLREWSVVWQWSVSSLSVVLQWSVSGLFMPKHLQLSLMLLSSSFEVHLVWDFPFSWIYSSFYLCLHESTEFHTIWIAEHCTGPRNCLVDEIVILCSDQTLSVLFPFVKCDYIALSLMNEWRSYGGKVAICW